ncbi:MAG: alpha/beta hydrolase [Deltaproteobacteria bacterium]|nr:alpha/beta hydrolase [Deltaproteobacteria bacterium]
MKCLFIPIILLGLGGCGGSASLGDDDAGIQTDGAGGGDADSGADQPVGIVEEFDVPYTPPADGDQNMAVLDIYYLPDGSAKHLMVFVHGGSWVGGDKSHLQDTVDLVTWFIDRGYTVAVPNFRLASRPPGLRQVTYADQATDLAFALAWLHDNRARYGVTEPGVLLLGFSSGAHLVALLAADEKYLQLAGLSHDHLAAAISFDVHAYDVPYALQLMQGSQLEQNTSLIEFLFGKTEAEQRSASPSTYAGTAAVPPTLLVSAEPSAEEGTHGYIASRATQRYAELLQATGHRATWKHYDAETHSSLVLDFGTAGDEPTQDVGAFLNGL